MANTRPAPAPADFAGLPALDRETLRALRDEVLKNVAARRELSRSVASIGEDDSIEGAPAVRKAIGLVLLGQHARAVACFDRAGEAATSDPAELWARAHAEAGRGRWTRAAEIWDTLLARDATDREALLRKAEALLLAGDLDGFAALAAERDELADERDADALVLQGLAQELSFDAEAAAARYEQALAVAPEHPTALFRLGRLAGLHGEMEEAIDLYQRLLDLPGAPSSAAINLGCLYEDNNDYANARSQYRRVLEEYPNEPRARLFLKDAESSLRMNFDEDQLRREELWRHLLETSITEFELSVRSRNCLEKMEIFTLGDLVRRPEEDLLQYKNFGDTSLSEIRGLLAERNLHLGMRIPQDLPPTDPPGLPAPAAGPADVLARPIGELELSIRARRCMESLAIQTLADLVKRSKRELLACRNFGQTSLDEVNQKLQTLGLTLREET